MANQYLQQHVQLFARWALMPLIRLHLAPLHEEQKVLSVLPNSSPIGCMQGPCEKGETGETLDNPSLVSVLLCTKLEMSDINKGN